MNATKTTQIGLAGFSRVECEQSGKVGVAMAWFATDGSGVTIKKATGLHDTYSEAYSEAKRILNIPQNNKVSDAFGEWTE